MRLTSILLLLIPLLSLGCSLISGPEPTQPASIDAEQPEVESQFFDYLLQRGDSLAVSYQAESVPTQEYHLNHDDLLNVRFPMLPEHDSEQRIRSDGAITLPYIGDVKIAGMTPAQASEHIQTQFASILRNPNVYLYVVEASEGTSELQRLIDNWSGGQDRAVLIRPDGFISLPSIGEIKAAGKTLRELSDAVNKSYVNKYPGLQVDLSLGETVGAKLYVLGEVGAPGAYDLSKPVTLTQAIALAGSYTNEADRSQVGLAKHQGDYRFEGKVVDLDDMLLHPAANTMILGADDVVFVPRSGLSSAAQVMQELTTILLFNGFSVSASHNMNAR